MATAINTKNRGKIVKRKNPVNSSESDEDVNTVVVCFLLFNSKF